MIKIGFKTISIVLIASMLSGCATIHRHPKLAGLVAGSAIGVGVGLATSGHGHCPNVYDGHLYSGTPPCPSDADKGSHR
jgi:hypothetical protein